MVMQRNNVARRHRRPEQNHLKPAISIRIGEPPRDKTTLALDWPRLLDLARDAGFHGVSVRASAVSVTSPIAVQEAFAEGLRKRGLRASMVTGDLALAVNDASATEAIRDINPYLDLAGRLGARRLRVMLHTAADISVTRAACDAAAKRGIMLVQQIHWGSLAETVEQAVQLTDAVGHPFFGITYEPANLLAATGTIVPTELGRLGPHLANVYFQNLRLDPESTLTFATGRGRVGVRYLPLGHEAGIDAPAIIDALRGASYEGWFTVHQPLLIGETVEGAITHAGQYTKKLLARS